MPALPWTTIHPVEPGTGVTVMASQLPLRSHRSTPRFLRWTLRIRRQLARSPGLVGYALDADLVHHRFWTVSAWTDRSALGRFAGGSPHHDAVEAIRPLMDPTTFVFWTATAADLPIAWPEVRRRVADAQAARDERPARS